MRLLSTLQATLYEYAWLFQPEGPAGGGGGGGGGGGSGGGGAGAGSGGAGGCMQSSGSLIMVAVMFAVFYFLLIRPQKKRAREHSDLLKNLKDGERVVTTGGLVGRITGLTDRYATIEVAEKVRVKVLRSNIAGLDIPDASEKGK